MKYGGGLLAAAVVLVGAWAADAKAAPAGRTCPKSMVELQAAARAPRVDAVLTGSGIGAVQIAALSKVACAMDEVIAFRPVNPAAGPWILAGAPTKDMILKPKSSVHPLIEGLLPTEQRHSKGASDPDKYNDYVDRALKGKDVTGTFNVTQVEVEVEKDGKRGLVCARGGALEVVVPREGPRKGRGRALATRRRSPGEAALRDFVIDGDCKVVTVLALQEGKGAPQPITADYDVFFFMSRAGVSRGVRHESPGGAIERRFGFTDDRDLELIRCMNDVIRHDLEAANPSGQDLKYPFDLVHHGPDTANPAKDDIDDKKKSNYFPALVVAACKAPVVVKDKQALQQLVLDLQRDKFEVPEAFTRAKKDGGYGLELTSTTDPPKDEDDPPRPPESKPKSTSFKFKQDQKLWLMYDFPVESGPKKCKWAVVTETGASASDGSPWYSIRWVDAGWSEDWSRPETTLVQWQQHCQTTGQSPKK